MSRFKKYTMTPISSKFSEKGGYSARFVGDGYTVDARKEILPGVIKDTGILIGEGAAWDFFRTFLQRCVLRVADTGETVTLDSLLSIGLSIQGWFANKDSKASKENVRVSAKLLKELKPNVVFTMSNENDGFTLLLVTVMSDGCALAHVKQAAKFRINGKYLQLLEGDKVTASAKNAAGDTVEAECAVIESAEDHIDATLPAAFNGDEFIGREITFKVEGRCGDPEAGTQTKSIEAILDKGEPSAPKSAITRVFCEGHEDEADTLYDGGRVTIEGTGLADATGCTFTYQDKAGDKQETVFGVGDFSASEDGTRIEISDDMLVEHMRNACSVAMSELDTEADATVKLTLSDGSILTYNVAIGG